MDLCDDGTQKVFEFALYAKKIEFALEEEAGWAMNNYDGQFRPRMKLAQFRSGIAPFFEDGHVSPRHRTAQQQPGLPARPPLVQGPPMRSIAEFPTAKVLRVTEASRFSRPVSPFSMTVPAAVATPVRRKKGAASIIALALGLSALLGALAFAAWNSSKAVDVTLYEVGVQNTTQYIGGGGTVFPGRRLDLSYPVAERVMAVFVRAGAQVVANQPLMQLDLTQLNAQIKQASDSMAAAQAYLNAVTAGGNAVTIAQARKQYDIAKSKYNELAAQIASPLLHDGDLLSPMGGVVTEVNIDPGEVFKADTPLLTIMDESVVVVHVEMPLTNLGQVWLNQPAIVTPSALPDRNFNGLVSAIIPQADAQADTFEVRVSVSNPGGTLLAGMSVFVRLKKSGRALVVPRLAVLNLESEPLVFVVRGQRAYLRPVQVMGRSGDAVLIEAGLSDGNRVVLIGQDRLYDGEAIRARALEQSFVWS
jgi:RND family efflux transporter MFP subunit